MHECWLVRNRTRRNLTRQHVVCVHIYRSTRIRWESLWAALMSCKVCGGCVRVGGGFVGRSLGKFLTDARVLHARVQLGHAGSVGV